MFVKLYTNMTTSRQDFEQVLRYFATVLSKEKKSLTKMNLSTITVRNFIQFNQLSIIGMIQSRHALEKLPTGYTSITNLLGDYLNNLNTVVDNIRKCNKIIDCDITRIEMIKQALQRSEQYNVICHDMMKIPKAKQLFYDTVHNCPQHAYVLLKYYRKQSMSNDTIQFCETIQNDNPLYYHQPLKEINTDIYPLISDDMNV